MSKKQQVDNQAQAADSASHAQQNDQTNEAEQRIGELTQDLQRLQAEFINYKNRIENEKAALSRVAKVQVVKDLLPVIDDLERALAHQPEELKAHKWAEGVAKVYNRLQNQLTKLGVAKIDALNQLFDPALHEAVQVEGEGDTQHVSEVLQSGYILGEQVIRHAVVKVKSS